MNKSAPTTYHYHAVSTLLEGDLYTPVDAYLKLRDLSAQNALMESSDYHSGENSRSFIGLNPMARLAVGHGSATATFPDGHSETCLIDDGANRLDCVISRFLARFSVEGEYANLCGVYGYTAFNCVRYTEHIDVKDNTEAQNDAPDLLYILYRHLIVFRDYRSEMMLVEMVPDGEEPQSAPILSALRAKGHSNYAFRSVGEVTATLTDDEHRANIRRGIKHCLRGDVFQIVLSRRFVQHYEGDDFQLYRALRRINPSPYLFYFDFGGFRIFGSSPETHCRIEGGRAYIDPIAGTTRRTGQPDRDRQLADALLANPKENAEHTMLVDLARNDLSRNCHDVKVDFYKDLQFYSHVIHLVSRVSGQIDDGVDPIKLFLDTFPAGTLSGAPKVRAMQLISQYEPHCRGAYGGCIGFIGLNGSLNQAITIRTFVSRNHTLWFQAGGGIVAKSDVEQELQEVNNKLGALRAAIAMADHLRPTTL